MNNDYYLEQIAQNTDNTEAYTQSIMGDLVALRYELAEYQEINHSGDMMLQNQINELKTENISIMCILMIALLFNFIVRCFK